MYLNLVAMANGCNKNQLMTHCSLDHALLVLCAANITTLNRVSIFARKDGFCLRKSTMKFGGGDIFHSLSIKDIINCYEH